MKLVRLRQSDHVITINEDEWPIKYSHQVASIGFMIEVRVNNTYASYVSGSVVQDGKPPHYSGKYLSSYTDAELYRFISMEAFSVAASLDVPAHQIWPLLDQFPEFSETGVRISDAEVFEEPIRDLLARGATAGEVMSSLSICRELYEFVVCERLPSEQPQPVMAQAVQSDTEW